MQNYRKSTSRKAYLWKDQEQIEEPARIKQPDFEEAWVIEKSGSIFSTPAVSNNKVFFGACDQYMYALSSSGELLWQFRTGDVIISSPTINNNVVYFGSFDQCMYALDENTGELIWKFVTNGKIVSSPAIVDNILYFGSSDGHLYALNAGNGRMLWKFRTGKAVVNTPAIVNNVVFFGSGDKNFYAISTDGKLLWKFPVHLVIGGVGSPVVINRERECIWDFRNRVQKKCPMIKDGLVIFASWDKNIYALSLDGQLVWKCLTNGINLTTHAVFNKTLFTGSFDKNIYAINCEDGKIRWQYNTNGIVLTIPIVHKEIVYFGSLDNNLYALNEADGTLVWKFRSGGSITASPTIVNNVLYLGCGDTNLYTINTETRGIIWSFQTGLGTQSDVKKSIAVVEEFDKQVFKIWKPETDVIGDDEPTEDMALSDLNFAGELRYGASNPYQAKRKSYKDVPQYIKRSSNKKSG